MLVDEYVEYTRANQEKYGAKTVVFMQCGDFAELYAYGPTDDLIGADIYTIGDLCNLQVTRKNKNIPECSRANPLMAGFPLYALQKHAGILVENGYTVVVIRQVTPPPNVKREITEIISPSTTLTPATVEGSYLLCCVFDKKAGAIGAAGLDITTGRCFLHEAAGTSDDRNRYIDEAVRLVEAYAPREILVYGDLDVSELFVGSKAALHKRGTRWAPFDKLRYQNEVFLRAFAGDSEGILEPIEMLGLERYDLGRLALALVIQFAFEHNENIVSRLSKPELTDTKTMLTLEYNSAVQLNLVEGPKPLLAILNRCGTAFGRRLFRERLLNPVCDAKVLGERYDLIDKVAPVAVEAHKILLQILDLERMARRMAMGTLSPSDWPAYAQTLDAAERLALLCKTGADMQELRKGFEQILDLDACSKYNISDIRGNVFISGVHLDLDEIDAKIKKAHDTLEALASRITQIDNGACKVDQNERDGYYLSMTKRRWETAKSKAPEVVDGLTAKPTSTNGTTVRITGPVIDKANDQIEKGQKQICKRVTDAYKEFVAEYSAKYGEIMKKTVDVLANIDVAVCCARNAAQFGYCRPTLDDSENSRFDAQGLRHPIIERIHDNVEYVANDLVLGDSERGLLLYGVNASGKSSLMKAVGLNVIMAQAGMYAAASRFTLAPYQHLFTRISGADNLYRGQSSFTVEMTELRMILQRSDARSLVLGDELCAGTEAISAISIVEAGVEKLLDRGCTFIFATHLHELAEHASEGLRIAHMHIDMCDGEIYYDRKLRDGRGTGLYGLEVCEGLGMPEDFLKRAHAIRRRIQQIPTEIVHQKASRYNAAVCMDRCGVCGEKATETHHIKYQRDADDRGFVGDGIHKNRASNLVPLCERCHLKEHNGEIMIRGYRQTSKGRILDAVKA